MRRGPQHTLNASGAERSSDRVIAHRIASVLVWVGDPRVKAVIAQQHRILAVLRSRARLNSKTSRQVIGSCWLSMSKSHSMHSHEGGLAPIRSCSSSIRICSSTRGNEGASWSVSIGLFSPLAPTILRPIQSSFAGPRSGAQALFQTPERCYLAKYGCRRAVEDEPRHPWCGQT